MVKVTVLGAAGGIGQPLSLLLKLNPIISHLSLYDIVNVHGVAADIGHINTPSVVTSHQGADSLIEAVENSHLVVIPAGVPRKPGMTRDDLFKINAGIVRDLATACAKACPKAFILIISNPVNSTTPIVAEVFKNHNVYDPKRIFGVTTLDSVRASAFVAAAANNNIKPHEVRLPVIGGHSGATIVPLFSQAKPSVNFNEQQLKDLTNRVQYGGDEVVKAKGGAGSATLSMAHAGARFTNALLDASVKGVTGIIEPGYVNLQADPKNISELKKFSKDATYFAFDIELSKNGVEKLIVPANVTSYETQLINDAVAELSKSIVKGEEFVKGDSESKL
ncbi:putative MDH1-malate dehydrogenase precursor, mitochondrial [Neoconidiobolus thromboides FSU 785]|nr:putative MDH1-malate dehydrogenase precursor, mitochondrial [Neoconidiobolus thromboides FSU 785]